MMKTSFNQNAAPYMNKEFSDAKTARINGDLKAEFAFLERAHVIGQQSTYYHVKVHLLMLLWAVRQFAIKEIAGQIVRIIGAAVLTSSGFVPSGNTGGSNVSPFRPMPVDPELAAIISTIQNPPKNN